MKTLIDTDNEVCPRCGSYVVHSSDSNSEDPVDNIFECDNCGYAWTGFYPDEVDWN